jgi:hypothetical protein
MHHDTRARAQGALRQWEEAVASGNLDQLYAAGAVLYSTLQAATAGPPDTWGWQGTPELDNGDLPDQHLDHDDTPPEGLAVFAHWSAVHDGVNVEMDVPDGLRVTVHFNEWLAVDATAGVNGNRGEVLDGDGSHSVACRDIQEGTDR